MHEYLTIVPLGDWRVVHYGGKSIRTTLRRFVIQCFHETAMGPHKDRDRTVSSIQDAGVWWSTLYTEVSVYVRGCLICSAAKARPLITGHLRSREYDGPFRYLIIDFVGPMSPTSYNGNRYMFTCVCAWSGWYWAVPCQDNTSHTAARCLFDHVMCDLAGYPTCLGHDRDKAFCEGVVQQLINFFGVVDVIGTAYHPQSQSAVERPHREYNTICKTFMHNFREWDRLVYIFVWSIRTSTKLFNGHYTPYEVITGLKPRSPIDCLLSAPTGAQRVGVERYVSDLVDYLRKVHKYVDEQHSRVRESEQNRKYRELGPGNNLAVGDYCLVLRQPVEGISRRFQRPTFDSVFQVVEVHGSGPSAKAYTLCDLAGSRVDLGFEQPVALERLVPIELLPIARTDDQTTRLMINDRGRQRPATIKAQAADGRVYVQYEDDDTEHCLDLSTMKYHWLDSKPISGADPS